MAPLGVWLLSLGQLSQRLMLMLVWGCLGVLLPVRVLVTACVGSGPVRVCSVVGRRLQPAGLLWWVLLLV